MKKNQVLVAMSGGVDSSIAAHLLCQEGYDCKGVMLKLHDAPIACEKNCRTCCSLDDSEDARRIAASLGFDFFALNYKEVFEERVINRFISEYLAGRTPNPCIDCNRFIKFGALLNRLGEYDCRFLATGHYARIAKQGERYILKKAVDAAKDQSYVLYSLTQEQLAKTLFPLGELTKKEVRQIAAECDFVNKDKPDSQDICFVSDGDYGKFIKNHHGRPGSSAPTMEGNFLDVNGNVLGEHDGAYNFTIGQRKGIGISFDRPMYVQRIEGNNVVLCENDGLFSDRLIASEVNLMAMDRIDKPIKCEVKIRYNAKAEPAIIEQISEGEIGVRFKNAQRAITPGQIAVFYDGDVVLGGGIISGYSKESRH